MKTPDYMTYSKYKKKKKEEDPKKGLIVGVTTFFVMLLIFTGIAKSLSPNVDVTIGEDDDVEAKESGLGVKRFIDDRLKMIQMEDGSTGGAQKTVEKKSGALETEYDDYSPELEEKVVLPNHGKDETKAAQDEQPTPAPTAAPRPNRVAATAQPAVSNRVTKVYVGYYSNIDQAKVAQGILIDSGLNITPFIKDLGGNYTLQVGSYSNKEKAIGLSNELLRNNFPARVVQE